MGTYFDVGEKSNYFCQQHSKYVLISVPLWLKLAQKSATNVTL